VTLQERQFIRKGGSGQFGKPFTGIRYEEYGFEGGPYLGFPESHDVYERFVTLAVEGGRPSEQRPIEAAKKSTVSRKDAKAQRPAC
jgi:hypothetical protein